MVVNDEQKQVDAAIRSLSPLEKVAMVCIGCLVKLPTKECAQGNGYANWRQNVKNFQAGRTSSFGPDFLEDTERLFPGTVQGLMSGGVPRIMPFRSDRLVAFVRSLKLKDLNKWHSELWEGASSVMKGLDSLLLLIVLGDVELIANYHKRYYRELVSFWVEDGCSSLTEILLEKLKTSQIQFADICNRLYGATYGMPSDDRVKKLERDKRRFQRAFRPMRGEQIKLPLDLKPWHDYFVALLELRLEKEGVRPDKSQNFNEIVDIYTRLFFWSRTLDHYCGQFLQRTDGIELKRELVRDHYDRILAWVERNL